MGKHLRDISKIYLVRTILSLSTSVWRLSPNLERNDV
jgi:hypothetical protein